MITKKGVLAIDIGILILLAGSKLPASEDETPEQTDTSQTTEDMVEIEEQLLPQRI